MNRHFRENKIFLGILFREFLIKHFSVLSRCSGSLCKCGCSGAPHAADGGELGAAQPLPGHVTLRQLRQLQPAVPDLPPGGAAAGRGHVPRPADGAAHPARHHHHGGHQHPHGGHDDAPAATLLPATPLPRPQLRRPLPPGRPPGRLPASLSSVPAVTTVTAATAAAAADPAAQPALPHLLPLPAPPVQRG